MPLVLMCGLPASGKSKVALDIQQYIESKLSGVGSAGEGGEEFPVPKLSVSIVTGESLTGFDRNKTYADPAEEKKLRGYIRSEVQRLLSPSAVVICDSQNYIKGYRYELYCVAKASSTSFCVVHCHRGSEGSGVSVLSHPGDHARSMDSDRLFDEDDDRIDSPNKDISTIPPQDTRTDGYTPETLTALGLRFEAPNGKNRWDSPLIDVDTSLVSNTNSSDVINPVNIGGSECSKNAVVDVRWDEMWSTPNDTLEQVFDVVTNRKQRLEPNQSTQSQPLAPTNFLHDVDKLTQDIVRTVIREQRGKVPGDQIQVLGPSATAVVEYRRPIGMPELTRLRRQFLGYIKNRLVPVGDLNAVGSMFVTFINSGEMIDS